MGILDETYFEEHITNYLSESPIKLSFQFEIISKNNIFVLMNDRFQIDLSFVLRPQYCNGGG